MTRLGAAGHVAAAALCASYARPSASRAFLAATSFRAAVDDVVAVSTPVRRRVSTKHVCREIRQRTSLAQVLPSVLRRELRRPARTFATFSSSPEQYYEAVVVGSGPAGITAVGNLLENQIAPVLWVDEEFNGGRVNKQYREVPSNTKVKFFVDYALATAPFQKIVSGVQSQSQQGNSNAGDSIVAANDPTFDKLQRLDQESGCELSHAADLCLMLTEGLRRNPSVESHVGRVTDAALSEKSSVWTVRIKGSGSIMGTDINAVQTKRLILCTGSRPTDPPLPVDVGKITHLNLDTALSPTKLAETLLPLGPTTVGVVGASHSAILALMNLANLVQSAKPDLHLKWFTRHPLRYAEFEDGFIARDNTGLKGLAATWARENLEPETLSHSLVSKHLTKIAYKAGDETRVYAQHLPSCDYIVQAIGFTRNPLPQLTNESSATPTCPIFDHDAGCFYYDDSRVQKIPGLFGAGIAFPERVIDRKYGHAEMNVGFFKFMKSVKRWVADWK